MIKAIIFDLDNTLLDFVKMKQFAVKAAITAMNEAGLEADEDKAYDDIMDLYVTTGWENQQVFDDYLHKTKGEVSNKILAAGVVAYRRAREATLLVYPNVNKTLIELLKQLYQCFVHVRIYKQCGLTSSSISDYTRSKDLVADLTLGFMKIIIKNLLIFPTCGDVQVHNIIIGLIFICLKSRFVHRCNCSFNCKLFHLDKI